MTWFQLFAICMRVECHQQIGIAKLKHAQSISACGSMQRFQEFLRINQVILPSLCIVLHFIFIQESLDFFLFRKTISCLKVPRKFRKNIYYQSFSPSTVFPTACQTWGVIDHNMQRWPVTYWQGDSVLRIFIPIDWFPYQFNPLLGENEWIHTFANSISASEL